jgi:transcriptional regulator with XRE-family HTH domain
MLITPDQIRAARALKNWSQADLAQRVDMATPSIGNIEAGKHTPTPQTQNAIIEVFEAAGIEFIDGGVRHQNHTVKVLQGYDGFADFRADVLTHAQAGPLDVCVNNVDERQFDKWGEGKTNDNYFAQMKNIKDLSFRILVHESDTYLSASDYAAYRWLPEDMFGEISFYVYADKTAIISFEDDVFSAFIIKHPRVANFYRREFDRLWGKAFEQKEKAEK